MANQKIILIVGGPRCLTNGIGKFAQRLGAGSHRCSPSPGGFNTNWAVDGDVDAAAALLLGSTEIGLTNPVRPDPVDPARSAAVVAALTAGAARVAPAPYLLCSATLPGIAPEIREAFPAATFDHVLVNMTRPRAQRIASLVAAFQREIDGAAGNPPKPWLTAPTAAQAGAYVDACDAERDKLLTWAQGRSLPVRAASLATLRSAGKGQALKDLVAGLGLREPEQADLDFIDPDQLTV